MIRRVRYMRFRKSLKLLWTPRERRDPCGNDNATRLYSLSIVQSHFETRSIFLHGFDLASVEFRRGFLLIPVAIVNEMLKGNRLRKVRAGFGLELIQRQFVVRVRNA